MDLKYVSGNCPSYKKFAMETLTQIKIGRRFYKDTELPLKLKFSNRNEYLWDILHRKEVKGKKSRDKKKQFLGMICQIW